MYILLCWSSDLNKFFNGKNKEESSCIFLNQTIYICGRVLIARDTRTLWFVCSSIYANEKYFAHRHKSTVFMFLLLHSRVKWSYTFAHTHTHTLHKTSFNGASHRVVFHYFHLHTSTEQQSIEEYRESSMKQTTIYLLIHLKWLKRSFIFTLSMKWNEMNKTIIFRWTKWIKYTFDESILCVQPNWFINAFINGNK